MDLFKIEDFLAEYRHYTRQDILDMPYYELSLKLGIIKDREAEKKDAQIRQRKAEEKNMPKIGNVSNSRSLTKGFKQPKAPSIKTPRLR